MTRILRAISIGIVHFRGLADLSCSLRPPPDRLDLLLYHPPAFPENVCTPLAMSENRNQGGAEHGEQQRVLFKKLGAAVDSVCIALLEKRFGPFEMNEWRDNMREMFYLHDLRQFDRAFDLIFKTTEGADYLLECLRELSLDIGSQYYMPDVSHSSISREKASKRVLTRVSFCLVERIRPIRPRSSGTRCYEGTYSLRPLGGSWSDSNDTSSRSHNGQGSRDPGRARGPEVQLLSHSGRPATARRNTHFITTFVSRLVVVDSTEYERTTLQIRRDSCLSPERAAFLSLVCLPLTCNFPRRLSPSGVASYIRDK